MAENELFRLLFVGDIVGETGRRAVEASLGDLRARYGVHFVVANGENAAGGVGITPKIAEFLFGCGVDVITGGNHSWRRAEIVPCMEVEPRLLRPANHPPGVPGTGFGVFDAPLLRGGVAVINLCGTLFMDSYQNPFHCARRLVERARRRTPVVVVDFHAEATSEKQAMGWYLDGAATAVLGTHTHVQTADERVLPGGTAYISDVGMTGAVDSVIGMEKEKAVARFLTLMPQRMEPATGRAQVNAVLIEVDPSTGKALGVERIQYDWDGS